MSQKTEKLVPKEDFVESLKELRKTLVEKGHFEQIILNQNAKILAFEKQRFQEEIKGLKLLLESRTKIQEELQSSNQE